MAIFLILLTSIIGQKSLISIIEAQRYDYLMNC
jgi:hypothetical protein